MAKKIRILSLDGGGVRALISIPVLAFLEAQLQKPLWSCFDYICGVSTGAFQAAALTMPVPTPAAQLGALYIKYAPSIFSRPWYASVTNAYGVNSPLYGASGIETALAATYGAYTLGQAKTNTMLLAYDCDANQEVYFQSYAQSGQYQLKDVLRASSAAPTYFPPAQIKRGSEPVRTFIDGGVVANNPALDCTVEACKREGATVRDCAVLSVGTGLVDHKLAYSDMVGWGALSWINPVLNVTMDGSSDLDDYRMAQLMPDAQYLRCQSRLPASLGQLDNAAGDNLAALQVQGQALVTAMRDKILLFAEQLVA